MPRVRHDCNRLLFVHVDVKLHPRHSRSLTLTAILMRYVQEVLLGDSIKTTKKQLNCRCSHEGPLWHYESAEHTCKERRIFPTSDHQANVEPPSMASGSELWGAL